MKFILDNNQITSKLLSSNRDDLFTLSEIANEFNPGNKGYSRIQKSNIKIVDLKDKHINAMIEIMTLYGDDIELIDLAEAEGMGDVAILAYVLGEIQHPDMFDLNQEFTIVTSDKGIRKYCDIYNIKHCNAL